MEEGGAAAGRGFWAGPEEGRGLGGAWAGLGGKVSTHLAPPPPRFPPPTHTQPVAGLRRLFSP